MAEFKLSRRAETKLAEIYAFTEVKYGRYQADAYLAGFQRTFGLLADFPRVGSKPINSGTACAASASSRI